MHIIVGLGNPGEKFKNTRHNAGFMVLDKFAEKYDFPEFKLQKKYTAEISEQKNVLLAKPQTFMNESGKTAKAIIRNYKSEIRNLVVVHDDADLPLGKIKIVKDRGSAGHKGVESIIESIGNKNLIRVRIGVSPCLTFKVKQGADKIVLKKFSAEEQKIIDEVILKSSQALDFLIKNGLEKTMNEFNS